MFNRTTITLNLTPQLHLACILYQIPAQQFIQNLITHIIIPSEHLELNQQTHLATDYFLEYAAINPSHQKPYSKKQKNFLSQKQTKYQRLLIASATCTPKERVGVLNLFEQWLVEWERLNV